MNLVDRLVGYVNPAAGLRRISARRALDSVSASYDATAPSKQRKRHRDTQSPQQLVERNAVSLRAQARHLERNHDIARGILRTLTNNIVGPNGIGIEPQPRRADDTVHEEYAAALREAWRDWCITPEVSHVHHWSRLQRLMAKAWLRDGEVFGQTLMGAVPFLDHGTRVPFSLEVFEADFVPMDYSDGARIRNGIECNAWGRPVGYYVYRNNPLDTGVLPRSTDLKRIPADSILHIAVLDRLGQLRGVSEFASVITRLDDIKDYEESERIAAKIAAALTAYVKRGSPDMYVAPDGGTDADGNPLPRDIRIAPGMIIDGLGIGEEIGLIDSKRPNPNVVTFRQGQLRAVAGGIGASYSSISRDYDGTYSAQRQELVEQWVHYAVLTDDFVGQIVQPVWERFVLAAHLSGVAKRPADVVESSADDALYIAQSMPWIDPLKEANAWCTLVKAGFASEVEVIRKRGGNPRDVLEQISLFRQAAKDKGLKFDSDAGNANAAPAPAPADPNGDNTDPDQLAAAVAGLAVAVQASGNKAPEVHVSAPVTVHGAPINVEPPQVTLEAVMPENPITVQVEPAQVTVEAPVTVEAHAAPAQVVVQHPTRARQSVERDAAGEITATITDYEVPHAHSED